MIKALCVMVVLMGATAPSHAFWGALSKLGSAAAKSGAAAKTAGTAGTAAKAGAAGGAVAVGAEAEMAAQAAAKATTAGTAAHAGDDIARASGLGKAVPDEIAAMMQAIPAKKLVDVPDLKAREWLAKPAKDLKPEHAKDIMATHDRVKADLIKQDPKLPTTPQHNWYLTELTLRAAHLGHNGAKLGVAHRCQNEPGFAKQNPQACAPATAKAAPAGKDNKLKTPS